MPPVNICFRSRFLTSHFHLPPSEQKRNELLLQMQIHRTGMRESAYQNRLGQVFFFICSWRPFPIDLRLAHLLHFRPVRSPFIILHTDSLISMRADLRNAEAIPREEEQPFAKPNAAHVQIPIETCPLLCVEHVLCQPAQLKVRIDSTRKSTISTKKKCRKILDTAALPQTTDHRGNCSINYSNCQADESIAPSRSRPSR